MVSLFSWVYAEDWLCFYVLLFEWSSLLTPNIPVSLISSMGRIMNLMHQSNYWISIYMQWQSLRMNSLLLFHRSLLFLMFFLLRHCYKYLHDKFTVQYNRMIWFSFLFMQYTLFFTIFSSFSGACG